MAFKPTGNRVVVRVKPVSDRTEGGLYVPETASPKEGPKPAEVVAVSESWMVNGNICKSVFQPGDKVLVDELGGAVARIDNEDLLVVRNEDILGIFQ